MNILNKDSIIQNEQEILTAMRHCDVLKLDQLLHEKLLFNLPNGQTINKTTDLQTYSTGNMLINEIKAFDQEINFIDNNAIVSVIIEMKGSYFDHPIDGKYKVLRVWKFANKQWQVIAGSSTEL